ncbi:hypothetical protein A2U01_0118019, partial [Trifolium medium]|nr:hypothetical protein [Trifolium medium]
VYCIVKCEKNSDCTGCHALVAVAMLRSFGKVYKCWNEVASKKKGQTEVGTVSEKKRKIPKDPY